MARPCPDFVTTHGEALEIVAVPIEVADIFPTAILPWRFGRLKVVEPSPTPYVVLMTEKRPEYVVRDTAEPSQRR